MPEITFKRISKEDTVDIELLAKWYWSEWKVEEEITRQQLSQMRADAVPFHVLMMADSVPVTAGGLYHDVRLLKVEPRFTHYDPWLALVYTPPEFRKQGYGYLICKEIQRQAQFLGLEKIYLYTITAESLYKRLG